MTRPRLATAEHRTACLRAVEKLLRDREAAYPALIERERMTAADAASKLELARVLLAQWRWVIDGAAEVPWDEARGIAGWGAYDFELAAELRGACERADAVATRQGSKSDRLYADLCEALHWWQLSDQGLSGVARIVSYTIACRTPGLPPIARAA